MRTAPLVSGGEAQEEGEGGRSHLLVQWGSKSALGVSIFLKSIWVLMEPQIMHSVGRFLRFALFPVDRRRRWGRLRLNPYCMKDYVHIESFKRVAFIPRRPIIKLSWQLCSSFGVDLLALVGFVSLWVQSGMSESSAWEDIQWKPSGHYGSSFHGLLQKQDIHQLLFNYRRLPDPSAPVGARWLWLAGKKLLCCCARWHGQLSVCALWLQQLSCFQAISSISVTLAPLIIPSKLRRRTFTFLISVINSC